MMYTRSPSVCVSTAVLRRQIQAELVKFKPTSCLRPHRTGSVVRVASFGGNFS